MAGLMIQVPKIVSAAVITICFGLIHATPPIQSFLRSGQEVPQPNSPQNPDAKPKAHSVSLSWKASTSKVATCTGQINPKVHSRN